MSAQAHWLPTPTGYELVDGPAAATLKNMATKSKCPWPKPHMRDVVKRALYRVGGQKAFDYRGHGEQCTIIAAAAFDLFRTAAMTAPITLDVETMWAVESLMREIAGMKEDES